MYRRADIKHTWSFDCICHRCQDRTELGTFVSGVNCTSCKVSLSLPAFHAEIDILQNAEGGVGC